jgi:integrase
VGQAIRNACKRNGLPHWHPHQLRHAAATEIRSRFGLEAAQVVLGHSEADTTQTYAAADEARARAVMSQVG